MKLRLNTDPHSPGRYRANVPLSNLPEFAEALRWFGRRMSGLLFGNVVGLQKFSASFPRSAL
jgi:hypothetical protein